MSLYKGNNLISGAMPNSANQSLSNLDSAGQDKFDAKVNKAGDTMTGTLAFGVDGTRISLKNISVSGFSDITFVNENQNRLGFLRGYNNSQTQRKLALGICNDAGTPFAEMLIASNNDVASCTFPNTTCCDGQWNYINTRLMNSVSLNGTTNLTYTLTNIPADGHNYEVLLTGNCTVSATANNVAYLYVSSDKIQSTVQLCRFNTRTNNSHTISGSVILPVSNSRKIYVWRASDNNGTANLWLLGYRRIGTNA